MAKKSLYTVGDVFKLPVGENIFGIGRILIVQSPVLFVGFFKRVVKNGEPTSIDNLRGQEYLIRIKCGDPGFKKKEWEIVGNLPLEEKIVVPPFWDRDPLTNELYLRRYSGSETDPLSIVGFKDRPTTEEEIKKEGAQPDGTFGWKAAEIRLKYELEKAGVL